MFPLIHFEWTVFPANTTTSLCASWINYGKYYRFVIFVIQKLWIHYLLRKSNMNAFSFWRIYYLWRVFLTNSSTFSRIHFEFTINFAKSLWIHYLRCEIILNSLSCMRIYRLFCKFIIFYTNSRWIIFFVNSESIYYLLREDTLNSLSISQIYYEFTIFFANWLCIDYTLHWITMNWLSFSTKTLLIRYLCRVSIIFYANSP